jgi:aspartate/methionine/tyrosine aminotransferase
MKFYRMPIEAESPEEKGYASIKYNLAESSLNDRTFGDLEINCDDLLLCYGDHRGYLPLRELLCRDYDISPDHIITAPGAAGALFLTAISNLSTNDIISVMHPNYMTNIVTPRIIGCQVKHIHISPHEDQWINAETVIENIHQGSKMVSITLPHNPSGFTMKHDDFFKIVKFTQEKGMLLLVDETYRDLHYGHQLPTGASLGNHVISISAVSKSYGVPGIRLGWLACANKAIVDNILAAKEQAFITCSILDEFTAFKLLEKRESWLKLVIKDIARKRKIANDFISSHPKLSWNLPEGGVVGIVKILSEHPMDFNVFYQTLYEKYQTYVGPGHWFELEPHYFRLGFGYPNESELKQGLKNIGELISKA